MCFFGHFAQHFGLSIRLNTFFVRRMFGFEDTSLRSEAKSERETPNTCISFCVKKTFWLGEVYRFTNKIRTSKGFTQKKKF